MNDVLATPWATALLGARQGIRSAMAVQRNGDPPPMRECAGFSHRGMHALRVLLPYCLHPVDRRGTLIWLNRDYKPLGVPAGMFVDYAMYPWLHIDHQHVGALHLQRECANNGAAFPDQHVYLFDDISAPWHTTRTAYRLYKLLTGLLRECCIDDPGGQPVRTYADKYVIGDVSLLLKKSSEQPSSQDGR